MWIAVPYVGGWNAVRSILGVRWRDSEEVRFRLLTDIDNKGWLDRRTIEVMNSHGKIKHLEGLHAKIYIIDDRALVTSANLAEMAFSRRHEVGVFLSPNESKTVVKTFEDWWNNKAELPGESWVQGLTKSSPKGNKEEPSKSRPSKLFPLPPAPPEGEGSNSIFRDYKAFQTSYREFAETYASLGNRLFSDVPLFIETDMFLDYLFHHDSKPSNKYKKRKAPRNLTPQAKREEMSKYKKDFRKWTNTEEYAEGDTIKQRMRKSLLIKRLLAGKKIKSIEWKEVESVLRCLPSMNAYDINRKKVLNPKNNSLKEVRHGWELLLHHEETPIEVRMTKCHDELIGFGPSAIHELLGWFAPNKYPIRNTNSEAGLRLLGY